MALSLAVSGLKCFGSERSDTTSLPPAEAPEGLGGTVWARQMNSWLDRVEVGLLRRITDLVGTEAADRYLAIEGSKQRNLYQRIEFRLSYIDKLLDHE